MLTSQCQIETAVLSSRLRFIFIIALLLVAPLTAVRAQGVGSSRGDAGGTGGKFSIQGRLIFPGSGKGAHLKVTLESTSFGTRATLTDLDGTFNFHGLSSGRYTITVEGNDDYEKATESFELYRDGGSSANIVPVYMKPNRRAALKGVPTNSVDLYLKGIEAAGKGNTKRAIEHFTAAVAAYPEFGEALSELGALYLKNGEVDKAIEVFQKAAKLIPNDFSTRLNYGFALMNKKRFTEAEVELREAIKKSPNAPIGHAYLGITLMSLKQMEEAEAELTQAVTLPGGDGLAQAHKFLGGILWSKREYKRAADELEKYLKLSPKAPDADRTREAIKELRSKT